MINPRCGFADLQSELFERSGELKRGMLAVIDLWRSVDQIFDHRIAADCSQRFHPDRRDSSRSNRSFRNSWSSSAGSFESSAKKLASGPYSIERTARRRNAFLCQQRNVLVTEDLNVRVRKRDHATALIAGSVRMKSPIAPPRITRMRFITFTVAVAL